MYKIDTKIDKPDIDYMKDKVTQLMNRGIRLGNFEEIQNYYSNLRNSLYSDISNKYEIDNPNSPQQVASYIKSMSNRVQLDQKNDILEICYDNRSNKWTTSKDALEKLSDLGYQFASDLLDYRRAKKLAESIESLAKYKDNNNLVHPDVELGKTHRINYRNPGLLTIPKKLLWHLIVPYTNGNVLYSVDIKNQEPNILINMTGADDIKYALESPDGLYECLFKECFKPITHANILIDTLMEDRVYSIDELEAIGTVSPAKFMPIRPEVDETYYQNKKVIGIEIICAGSSKGKTVDLPNEIVIETEDGETHAVNVKWDATKIDKCKNRSSDYTVDGIIDGLDIRISKVARKEFKTAWNAISYGATIFGVNMQCKTIDGNKVYNYITKIDALKNYRSLVGEHAKKGNQIIKTLFGTPMYAGGEFDPKRLKRILLDLPIQGTGADILSLLIKHFYEYIEQNGLSDKLDICYTRHDELIIEVNGKWLSEVGNENVTNTLRDILEHQINDWTPFKVEIEQTKAEDLNIDYIYEDD